MPRKVTYIYICTFTYANARRQSRVRASDTAPGRRTIYVLMSDRGYSFEDTVYFFMGIIIYACTSASCGEKKTVRLLPGNPLQGEPLV